MTTAETIRFRRKRLAILGAVCAVIGTPFLLTSHRGAIPFEIGATTIGLAASVLVLALLLPALKRISR